ncbi:cytochrome p450 family protein [Colletotrichum incanum]|uniref:Multifunctional cytochrome P450 monooxygenase cimlD n=1 Tax=Colletotrichum incanum TaxID=1573173 RepID=CIMLD_COLIC|nr:cytochrome p450 family protein [Colletotrichum incanum]
MIVSSISLLATAGACLVLYITVSRLSRWRRLNHIPGPPGAGWSRLWLLVHLASGKLPNKFQEICRKYGPLVRIAPNWVVCSDPNEIRRIWGIRSGYHRGTWYRSIRLSPDEENIFTILGNKDHHRLRAQLLPGYGGKSLVEEEERVNEQIVRLVALLEQKYLSSETSLQPCNLARTMQYLTQDIITAVGFGKPAGYLNVDQDMFGLIKASETVLLPAHIITIFPLLGRIMASPLLRSFLPKPTDEQGVGRFLGFVRGHVDSRYEEDGLRRSDILQTFVDSGMRRSQVESEALVMLFGGTDTTATALRNIIFYLSTNPRAYQTLQAEIDAAVGSVDRPVISDVQAKSLPFLQACIKEGLRLWPPSIGMMGKVSDQDDTICGIRVPAQTQIGWAATVIMKDRRVFGENAAVFEPTRWLKAEPERLKEMESIYGLVFATNTRWECLGKRLAYIELGKVLFELFCRFDFSMVNPVEPFRWMNHGFTVQQDMHAKITQRASGAGGLTDKDQ